LNKLGEYAGREGGWTVAGDEARDELLVMLYVAGDDLLDTTFKMAVIDEVLRLSDKGNRMIDFTPRAIGYVWDHVSEMDKMRDLLVDGCATTWHAAFDWRGEGALIPEEFMMPLDFLHRLSGKSTVYFGVEDGLSLLPKESKRQVQGELRKLKPTYARRECYLPDAPNPTPSTVRG
jgi:hypothetical protein